MKGSSTLFLRGQTPYCATLIGSSKYYKGILHVKKHPIIRFCNNIQTSSYEVANGSYIPTLQTEDKNNKEKPSRKLEAIGAFQKLPMVMPSIDILGSALRKARRVSPTKGIVNTAKREKNKGAKQLDALMKELAVPLRTYVENFPKKTYLHPYERSLVELTLGDGYYETVLGKVDALRKKLVSVGKEHASLCAKSSSKREAEERLNQGIQRVEDIFAQEGKVVDDLLGIAKTLRAMPVINLETPTLCLVGAPNVGKSSLVRVLSTGKPEVCNYPFTTRGILIGHIVLNYQKFQVTDTPGLLKRQYEDRNNLEKLTLAALSHLPTAILYVHDLSGECGTSPADQHKERKEETNEQTKETIQFFTIYQEIRENFTKHLWLDVVSKSDLLEKAPVIYATEDADPEQFELMKYRKSGPDGALHVSVKTEQGLHELKCRVYELLKVQMAKINDGSKNQEK